MVVLAMAFIVGRMAFSRGTTTLGEQAPCAACEQIVPVIVTCLLLLWKLDLPTAHTLASLATHPKNQDRKLPWEFDAENQALAFCQPDVFHAPCFKLK